MNDQQYYFSVVMAVYNTQEYLKEAIDSIVEQDIGFDHIQLIIVNDGSTDGSLEIAKRYAQKYANIVVIDSESKGVSKARNIGCEYAIGKYINFLDSDDRIEKSAFRKAKSFFDKYYDRTDIASIPLIFFDGRSGDHHLNYKYKNGTRVIYLDEEWDAPQMQISSCFIKKDVLEKDPFDERLRYSEDAKLIQKILLKKKTLGVIDGTCYFYRKRTEGMRSAIQSSIYKPAWYLPCIEHYYKEVIELYEKEYGSLPKFIQNTICSDLQWRIEYEAIPENVLSKEEEEEYIRGIKSILCQIENDVILAQREINNNTKKSIFKVKNIGKTITRERTILYQIGSTSEESFVLPVNVLLENFRLEDNRLCISGICFVPFSSANVYVKVIADDKEYRSESEYLCSKRILIDDHYMESFTFSINGVIENDCAMDFLINMNGDDVEPYNLSCREEFPCSDRYENMSFEVNDYLLHKAGKRIIIERMNQAKKKQYAVRLFCQMLRSEHISDRKAAFLRIIISILRLLYRNRECNIVLDASEKEGYLYVSEQFHKEKSSHKREQEIHRSYPIRSKRAKLYYLCCDRINFQKDAVKITNLYPELVETYKDLIIKKQYSYEQ